MCKFPVGQSPPAGIVGYPCQTDAFPSIISRGFAGVYEQGEGVIQGLSVGGGFVGGVDGSYHGTYHSTCTFYWYTRTIRRLNDAR